ncbi:MAG: hypothetical protein FJX76_28130 [Armatimonadetes bacterium]|nr:hypothetical protein [Armatimonadota bacterium]
MLLDDSTQEGAAGSAPPSAPSGTPGAGGAPSPSRRKATVIGVVVLLIAGLGLWAYSWQRGIPLLGAGTAPPPDIFSVRPGTPLATEASKGFGYCANPNYEYWFRFPLVWTASIPGQYSEQRARMLVSKELPNAAILVIPFGMYGQDESEEIAKAELTYIGQAPAGGAKTSATVDGKPAFRRAYSMRVMTTKGPQLTRVEAVYVINRPKCYALFLRCSEEQYRTALESFNSVVASFHLEKLPIQSDASIPPEESPSRDAPGKSTASPDASGKSTASPEARKASPLTPKTP